MGRLGDGGADLLAQVEPYDRELAHHPLDPLAVDDLTLVPQLGGHPPSPVSAVVLAVDGPDLRRELLVRGLTGGPGRRGAQPVVEARPADLENLTQPLHAEGVLVVLNELEAVHQRVSPAKYLAARRRISRSSCSSRTCRRNSRFSASNCDPLTVSRALDRLGHGLPDSPRSLRATRIQFRSVSGLTPDPSRHPPEWCVYIAAAHPEWPGHGLWAHLEHDVNTGRPELRLDRPHYGPGELRDRGVRNSTTNVRTRAALRGHRGVAVVRNRLDHRPAVQIQRDGHRVIPDVQERAGRCTTGCGARCVAQISAAPSAPRTPACSRCGAVVRRAWCRLGAAP